MNTAAQATVVVREVPRWTAVSVLSEFPLEWCAVAAIALIDFAWAVHVGFTLTIGLCDLLAVLAATGGAVFFRTRYPQKRIAIIAEYFALCVVATSAFAVLSYLCCALSFPLIDLSLLRLDGALGFDWLHWFDAVQSRPILLSGLHLIYASLAFQAMYFLVLFGLLHDRARLREVFWIVFVASAVTSAISAFLPALGPFETFNLGDLGGYLADMKRLRQGSDLHFSLEHLTGVVSFPSFHTTIAIVYAYGFRRTGIIGVVMAGVNLAMIPSIPIVGGHYLIDMLAGALVAVVTIALVRACLRPALAKETSHQTNARSALSFSRLVRAVPQLRRTVFRRLPRAILQDGKHTANIVATMWRWTRVSSRGGTSAGDYASRVSKSS